MDRFDFNNLFNKLYKNNFWNNLSKFFVGTFISAFAFNLFFKNYDITPTGSGGFSLLLSKFIPIDVSIIILMVGLICLLIGLIGYGWQYATKMLIITFLSPLCIKISSLLVNYINLGNTSLFLIAVFGGVLVGLANGLIRNSGYSPGGFAVLFDLLNKYFHISIGAATLAVNLTLIIASAYVFDFNSAIYACISLIVSSYMVDRVMFGISDNKVFYIVTKKTDEISEYIINKLHYSVTLINAKSGTSNKSNKLIMSVISTKDYVRVKELLRAIDKNIFFLIVDTYESSVRKNI